MSLKKFFISIFRFVSSECRNNAFSFYVTEIVLSNSRKIFFFLPSGFEKRFENNQKKLTQKFWK